MLRRRTRSSVIWFFFPVLTVGVLIGLTAVHSAKAGETTAVPALDARDTGTMARQGISALATSENASVIAVGTAAPPGEANVVLLDGEGELIRAEHVGIRWIAGIMVDLAGTRAHALAVMNPPGQPGNLPTVYKLPVDGGNVVQEREGELSFYFYGSHSNHPRNQLRSNVALLDGELHWLDGKPSASSSRFEGSAVSLAVAQRAGLAVVGASAIGENAGPNLTVFSRGHGKPLWSRTAVTELPAAPSPEPPRMGKPRPNVGSAEPRPLDWRREKAWAPLSVAIHADAEDTSEERAGWRVAAADYQGWQLQVFSNARRSYRSKPPRFMPTPPAITVYNNNGEVLQRFEPKQFGHSFWCDLAFSPDGTHLLAWPHNWNSRGLAGRTWLPADEQAESFYVLDIETGRVERIELPDAVSDVAVDERGLVLSCWNGRIYFLSEDELAGGRLPEGIPVGGPAVVRIAADASRLVVGTQNGRLHLFERTGRRLWSKDLQAIVPEAKAPGEDWTSKEIHPGIWRNPGRYRSDMGNQYVVEAPQGLILIDPNAGHSFERQWRAMPRAGLDPKRVKYVIPTHPHGDHAPGAYLWRQRTGAKVIATPEMAYKIGPLMPAASGYGIHPPNPADILVRKDTERQLAGLPVRFLRLPGHTYGSLGLTFTRDGKRYVFTGDLIMIRGRLGYAGSDSFSARDVLHSLRKLQKLDPDVALGGHGMDVASIREGIENGVHTGWGKMPAEDPQPYFHLDRSNYRLASWNEQAAAGDFGDLNGDGLPDVATLLPASAIASSQLGLPPQKRSPELHIFLNRSGDFAEREPDHVLKLPELVNASDIFVLKGQQADKADLLITGSKVVLLEATAMPLAYQRHSINVRNAERIKHALRANLTGDSRREVLLGKSFGSPALLREQNGSYQATTAPWKLEGTYMRPYYRDLNGDGRRDLISSGGTVYLARKEGRWPSEPTVQLRAAGKGWTFGTIGDFNVDGAPDVALVTRGDQTVSVFENTGDAKNPFAPDPSQSFPVAKRPIRSGPLASDWNGDGHDDLLIVSRGREQLILFGGPEGLAKERSRILEFDHRVHYENFATLADFTGDGRDDWATYGFTDLGGGAGEPRGVFIYHQPAASSD